MRRLFLPITLSQKGRICRKCTLSRRIKRGNRPLRLENQPAMAEMGRISDNREIIEKEAWLCQGIREEGKEEYKRKSPAGGFITGNRAFAGGTSAGMTPRGLFTEASSLREAAFADMQESDHQEHHLVDKLHNSDTYIPELSLVAKTDKDEIVGYILLTKVEIVSESGAITSLAVAPLAVLPEYGNRGIGGIIVRLSN